MNPLSFSGLKSIAKMIGIQLVPLPETSGRIDAEQTGAFCRQEHIKGIYLIPTHHNPTTRTMTPEERRLIGDAAKKEGFLIIEDAIHQMFSSQKNPPLFSCTPQQTIYIFSISKCISPGLRVSYLIVPSPYRKAVQNALYAVNLMVSPINLEIAGRLLTSPLLPALIEAKKRELTRRDPIVRRMLPGRRLYGEPTCQFRWLPLPPAWDNRDFERAARKNGVFVFCADRFAIGNTPPPKAVRLAVSSPRTEQELAQGLSIIRSLLSQK